MNEYETIRARVSRETKLKFAAAAQRHGCRSEAQLLRLMLDKVLHTEETPALSPTRKSRSAGIQVNVLLTAEEHQLLTAAATGEGLRRTEWIVKLIRATLLRQPQFNRTEVDALAESSRQLAAIGRNLNQIARTLNMDPNASRSVTVERVETLSADIKRHCALVVARRVTADRTVATGHLGIATNGLVSVTRRDWHDYRSSHVGRVRDWRDCWFSHCRRHRARRVY